MKYLTTLPVFRSILNAALVLSAVVALLDGTPALADPDLDPPPHQEQVTAPVQIESIEITGTPGINRQFVLAALDVKTGQTLEHDVLSQKLAAAGQKLTALGYYEHVAVELKKGSKRGNYIVGVDLVPHNRHYVGANVTLNREDSPKNAPLKLNKWQHAESVFTGIRDLGFGGINADLEIENRQNAERYAHTTFENNSKDRQLSLNLSVLIPDIHDTPFFAMMRFYYLNIRQRSHGSSWSSYDSERYTYSGSYIGKGNFSQFGLGARRGFYSAMVYGVRGNFKLEFDYDGSSHSVTNDTYPILGAQIQYFEKSQLAAVEPGAMLYLDYSRRLGRDSEGPTLNTFGAYTAVFWDRHALTPWLFGSYDWSRNEQGDSSPPLIRTVDFSLAYEYVSPLDWVFSIEPGVSALINDQSEYRQYPAKRLKVGAKYVSASLITNFDFIYGYVGRRNEYGFGQASRIGVQ